MYIHTYIHITYIYIYTYMHALHIYSRKSLHTDFWEILPIPCPTSRTISTRTKTPPGLRSVKAYRNSPKKKISAQVHLLHKVTVCRVLNENSYIQKRLALVDAQIEDAIGHHQVRDARHHHARGFELRREPDIVHRCLQDLILFKKNNFKETITGIIISSTDASRTFLSQILKS